LSKTKSKSKSKKRTKKPYRALRDPAQVAGPSGISISTRVWAGVGDCGVLFALGDLLTTLRNQDLRRTAAGVPWDERKSILTPLCSSRWAGSITRDNNDQLRLSRDNLLRAIEGWTRGRNKVAKRLALPIPVKGEAKPKGTGRRTPLTGYASQAERAAKQLRLAYLDCRIAQAQEQLRTGHISICKGGSDFLNTRHNLEDAGLTEDQWREQYKAKRMFLTADGEKRKRFGNETIRVGIDGSVVIKLPPALYYLANHGKTHYKIENPVRFSYRMTEWAIQIANNRPVSYSLSYDPDKRRWHLSASWIGTAATVHNAAPNVLAIDLNADHLSARVVDLHGNPVGSAITIPFNLKSASSSKRDALVRAAITAAIHIAKNPPHKVGRVVIEDLGFEDSKGREKFGHNKVFRATISGFPVTIFRERARAMIARAGLELWVVDPAYSSKWGKQHWQKLLSSPTYEATTHEGAAVVIGRRQLGYRARTRTGVGRGEQSIAPASLPSAPGQGPNNAPGSAPPSLTGIARASNTRSGRTADKRPRAGGDRCLPDRFFAPEGSSVRFVRF
jgi:hypothetical protein